MKIAVHYKEKLHEANFAFKWIHELEKRGVEVLKVDFQDEDIIDSVRECDGVMWNWFHLPVDKISAPYVLNSIEENLGIPTFPNFQTRWHYDEKIAQYYMFKALNIPSTKSWLFFNYDKAIEFVNNAKYPMVFKLSVGASSSNVIKINNKQEAINITNMMFSKGIEPNRDNLETIKNNKRTIKTIFGGFSKNDINYPLVQKEYVYFQEYLPNNKYDIRVNVIGERIFAFVRHNRENDFRASGSGKIDYNKELVPHEVLKIAYEISSKNNFQSMAYDFLKDQEGRYLINEISYSYRSDPVTNCNGYWTPSLEFINNRISPEEAIVEDFIQYIKNKQ